MNDHRISRRSFLAAAGMAGAAAALTACGGASNAASSVACSAAASSEVSQSVELIVFAAASLTETLNAIGESYMAEHPEVTFRFNFDSSGTLKTQIQEGADCDLHLCRSEADEPAGYHRLCRGEQGRAGLCGCRQPREPVGEQGGALRAGGQ